MTKKLVDVSEHDYKVLMDMGYLYEMFPEATGDWEHDTLGKTLPSGLSDINSKEKLGAYLCAVAEGCADMSCKSCSLETNQKFEKWLSNLK